MRVRFTKFGATITGISNESMKERVETVVKESGVRMEFSDNFTKAKVVGDITAFTMAWNGSPAIVEALNANGEAPKAVTEDKGVVESAPAMKPTVEVETPKPDLRPMMEEAKARVLETKRLAEIGRVAEETGLTLESIKSGLTLRSAIALLSRQMPVSQLPPGSLFSISGKFGKFLEMTGADAKVEVDGKTAHWSGATMVKWAAEMPSSVAAVKVTKKDFPVVTDSTANGKVQPTVSVSTPKVGKPRNQIFGHAATRVVMWCGKNGMKAEQVEKVLAHFGVTSTPASINTFIRSGLKGDRGPLPVLTAEQAAQLVELASK